jgi:hypothetical protein
MINGVLTDVTVEQYVKLKEMSQDGFASPDVIDSRDIPEKKRRLLGDFDPTDADDDDDEFEAGEERGSELRKALMLSKQLETLQRLYEMNNALSKEVKKGDGLKELATSNNKVSCPCGFEKDVKAYLPKEGEYDLLILIFFFCKRYFIISRCSLRVLKSSPQVGVKNVAALLHLKGEAETKKWLSEHGADNKRISECMFCFFLCCVCC